MLPTTSAELDRFLIEREGPNLECKEARGSYDSRKLRKYLSALANEGGGFLVFGITDQPPRQVVGSTAFPNIYADLIGIQQDLHPPPFLDARAIDHAAGRVLVFEVGPRPRGQVVRYDDRAWIRLGESLVLIGDEEFRRVLLKDVDLTDDVFPASSLHTLDPEAIDVFRRGIVAKARTAMQKERYEAMPPEQLLRATGLMRTDGALRRAAILLLGRESALAEEASNAEIVFEYRSSAGAARYDDRFTVRNAILLALNDLWSVIQPYAFQRPIEVQRGTRVDRLPRFSERSVREAVLNAVVHRDYQDTEGVLIRMSPEAFEVTSPGAFPATITPANVAEEQYRRNRRLAEALDKCGQIERSGQGVDLMIEAAVRMAQPLPTFEEPGGRNVRVTLHGEVDASALPSVQQIQADVWPLLSAGDLVALDAVRRGVARRDVDADAAARLLEQGLIEPGGPGDTPYRYASDLMQGQNAPNPSAIPRVLAAMSNAPSATLAELHSAVSDLPLNELRRTLQWLRRNGFVKTSGRTRSARWHMTEGGSAVVNNIRNNPPHGFSKEGS